MKDNGMKDSTTNQKINRIEPTKEKITGRGGLALFVRYLEAIGIYKRIEDCFGSMRKSAKGLGIKKIFKQLFCFFMDGESFHMLRFDELAKDDSYAATIETRMRDMASSHTMKRFFEAFDFVRIWQFRKLLQELFIWRMQLESPKMVILNLDTMVMDNDDAKKREGVKPTYKKVKGFQPLQLSWNNHIVDAVFRSGDKHNNNGDTAAKMVSHVVKRIRKRYSEGVPIILRCDSGFFSGDNLEAFEGMGIGYICSGKMLPDIRMFLDEIPLTEYGSITNGQQEWLFYDFGDRRGCWKRFRRAIHCSPVMDENQVVMEFARPDTIIYTNIGVDKEITEKLVEIGEGSLLDASSILRFSHDRGADELVNRALKEFGTEQLPFKRFESNAAFYYIMLLSFFLYECFKKDVAADLTAPQCYPSTFRRKMIDIGAKIIRTSGMIIMKVNRALFNRLNLDVIWTRCNSPPVFAFG